MSDEFRRLASTGKFRLIVDGDVSPVDSEFHRFLRRQLAICDEDGRASHSDHVKAQHAIEAEIAYLRKPDNLTDDQTAVLEVLASCPAGWKLRDELWPEMQREYPGGRFGLAKIGRIVKVLIARGYAFRASEKAPIQITKPGREVLAEKKRQV